MGRVYCVTTDGPLLGFETRNSQIRVRRPSSVQPLIAVVVYAVLQVVLLLVCASKGNVYSIYVVSFEIYVKMQCSYCN